MNKIIDSYLNHFVGAAIILAATLIFFLPYLMRIDSYSAGGDAMFNAWILSRNHHCILRDNCPRYVDGNIFFPHKDSMLFSETQLSAGLLTVPLYFINPNPIFAYNVWTIASFFFCGLFMYLLARHLSHNHEVISVMAGLIFEFAPIKMAALHHLQNLSIFYLPLIFLLLLKYLDTQRLKYLLWMFGALVLYFYASWYQMAFSLLALIILIGGLLIFGIYDKRRLAYVSVIIIFAILSTLPLAREYLRFSKLNSATFSERYQIMFSSSLIDYATPQWGTISGKLLQLPTSHKNAYNPDSTSYHGLTLYVVAGYLLVAAYRAQLKQKQNSRQFKFLITFALIGFSGFLISLGPFLKLFDSTIYHLTDKMSVTIPLPFIIVNRLFTQLSFIRAPGRASALVLFSLCCLLAFLPLYLKRLRLIKIRRYACYTFLITFIVIEIMPFHLVPMVKGAYAYNLTIPQVYQFIRSEPEIDNLLILHSDLDYPDVPWTVIDAEQTMWAGYTNKHIFNGYSGYNPPTYYADTVFFNTFPPEAIQKLRQYGLQYVLVDKQLSKSKPEFIYTVTHLLPQKVYEDDRFTLLKVD